MAGISQVESAPEPPPVLSQKSEQSYFFQRKKKPRERSRGFLIRLGQLLAGDDAVLLESTGQNKFAELVPDHVLGDVHRNKHLPVVDVERVSDKLRDDHRAARPSLDRHFFRTHLLDLIDQILIDERALLNRSGHYFFLRSTMKFFEVFFGLRVRLPLASWPHGETGWPPPEVRPSPPPIGWSTGFIATPRLCGRNQR